MIHLQQAFTFVARYFITKYKQKINVSINLKSMEMKQKFTLFILIVLFFLPKDIQAQTATQPSGSGTEADPYQIATLNNLYWITQNSGEWDKHYIQTANIDASSTSGWDSGSGFSPIGTEFSNSFSGSYNGQNFAIDGITINRPATYFVGLFGYVRGVGAVIQNLNLTNVSISGYDYSGALTGLSNQPQITNCSSSGSVTGHDYVGGLVGFSTSTTIVSSNSSCSVSGNNNTGGLIGSTNGSNISSSYNTGTVSGNQSVGGLVGYNNNNSNINNSYNSASVSSTHNSLGGLVGSHLSGTISSSYNIGSITASNYRNDIGGLVGSNYSAINNSYSTGSITCPNTNDNVGGLVGNNNGGTINNSYSIGNLDMTNGGSNVGGLVGLQQNSGTTNNSFWNMNTSGQSTSAAGVGKTTAQMLEICTFVDGSEASWDFMTETTNGTNDYWGMNTSDNSGYPFLSWQGFSHTAMCCPQPAGAGTLADPYQITKVEELCWVSQNTSEWDKYYIQTADIDASGTSSWNSGAGFSPIGNSTTQFTGNYDGKGYTIDGLFINRPSTDNIGLFGYANGAEISNLGITNCDYTGQYRVGVIVGYISGSNVHECYSSGSVSGLNMIGGLAGANVSSTTISNCYSLTNVNRLSGTSTSFGAFVGSNTSSTVQNCYAVGNASYTGATNPTDKGFAGSNTSGTYNNNFFDSDVSNQSSDVVGAATAKTTAEMQDIATFTNTTTVGLTTAWDFTGTQNNDAATDDPWNISSGTNNGYPYLQKTPEGAGTQADPFQIATIDDLFWLSQNSTHWNKYYIQTANIDATSTNTWNVGDHDGDGGTTPEVPMGFSPIGNLSIYFRGSYNGQGYTIDALYINRISSADGSRVGLFGLTYGGLINNLGLTNVNIAGYSEVGALVGGASSEINSCYSTGTVSSTYRYTGGLIGRLGSNSATMNNCYSNATVSSTEYYAGGLIGRTEYATLSNSYSTGAVSGAGHIGGLIGSNNASTTTISNSFWDTQTSGQATSAAGTGRTTAEMKELCTFVDGSEASWDFMSETNNGTDDIWGMNSAENNGYPFLAWQGYAHTEECIFELTITGITVNNKVYDGNTDATLNGTATLVGVQSGDDVTLVTTGVTSVFTDKNIGATKTVNVSGYTITGTDVAKYSLTQPTGLTANITAKELTVTGASASNKVYDSNTDASLTGGTLNGVESGDAVTLVNGTGTFASEHVGTGISVTANYSISGADAGNYNLTQPTGLQADITEKALTITGVTASDKTYDGTTDATVSAGSLSGAIGGDDLSLSQGSGTFNNRYVGTDKSVSYSGYNISGTDAGNYSLSQPTSTSADITAKALTVSGATVTSKTYDGNTDATITNGSLTGVETIDNGNVTLTSGTGTFASANAGTGISVTANYSISGSAASNYTLTQPTGLSGNIIQATLTATADNKSKTYGEANPALTFVYSGFVNGETNSVIDTEPTASTTATTGSNAGNYSITVSGGSDNNYSFAYVSGTLTINKADQTITITAIDDKDINVDPHTFDVTASTTSGLTLSYAIQSGPATISGNTITLTGETGTVVVAVSQAGNGNYNAANTQTENFNVFDTSKDDQTITFGTLADKTYGDADFNLTATASSGLTVSYTIISGPATVSANTVSITGAGSVTIEANQGGDDTYNPAPAVQQSFTVNKATLTATADNKSKTYGDANPTLTITYSGFVNSENSSVLDTEPTASTTADATSNVGNYDITVSGGSDDNYSFTNVSGTLTVHTKELTVTGAVVTQKTYDANTDATITNGSLNGVEAGDDVTLTSGTGTFASANAGTGISVTANYSISGTDAANYNLSQPTLTGNITKATLVANADNKTKVYGDANPTFTISYTGFVNGETATVIDTEPTASTIADASSNVGTYDITLSGGSDNNYSFGTLNNATLTVNKVALTATADNKSKTYGDANPTLTITYSGFVNSENSSVLDTEPTASTTANASSDAGAYDITVSGGSDNNYSFNYVSGTLTINKADQTITITSIDDKDVATDALSFNVTANTTSGLTLSYAIQSGPATISGNTITLNGTTGTVVVEVSQSGNNNYNAAITQTESFNVFDSSKDDQTITFGTLADKTYGDDDFDLTATASSGLTIAYTVISGPVTISGSTVTITGAGNVTIEANQAGNDTYNPALAVRQSFTVNKADQTISIETIGDKNTTDAAFDIVASTTSGLDLSYAIQSGPATISGTTITLDGTVGTVVVAVSQAGDDNYNGASETTSFDVQDATGIEEAKELKIAVYPNPTSDFVKIEFDKNKIEQLRILDFNGKVIFDKSDVAGSITIDLSIYEKGTYILQAISANQVIVKKIIKL